MTEVWQRSTQKGSALLLLLAIADHAHDDGSGAYPSVPSLAKKVRMSERNTQYLLLKLEASGELEIHKGAGPMGCNLFRVQSLHPVKSSVVGGEIQRSRGVKPIAPKPLIEPLIEPSVVRVSSPTGTKRRSKTPIVVPTVTDEFRGKMVVKYNDVWDAEEINARITMVLGSDSILKYHTLEAVETNIDVIWLGRDAKQERDRRGRNGQYQNNHGKPQPRAQTPRPGDLGYNYLAGIPARGLPNGGNGAAP